MAWITIHFGRNPRNGGSPPKDRSDVNCMNFISVISLFVIPNVSKNISKKS
jgi:hypothetical protein